MNMLNQAGVVTGGRFCALEGHVDCSINVSIKTWQLSATILQATTIHNVLWLMVVAVSLISSHLTLARGPHVAR